MRVLVTGVSGFLGARLARLLCEQGHQVRGTYRPGDETRVLDGLQIEAVACDVLDEGGTRRAVSGVEAVFHVAAMVSFDPAHYWQQMRVNVDGTRVMLDACEEAGVSRLVHTSTVSALGAPDRGQVGHEGTPFDWTPWRLGYMDSKKAAEDLVTGRAQDGLDALSVLPGTFFGPGDVNNNAGQYILQCARGVLRAAPPGGTSVVHVDDVAQGHLAALQRGQRGGRYVLGGENLTYHRLFSIIAEELGRPPPAVILPRALMGAAGRASDWLRSRAGAPLPLTAGLCRAACAELFYASDHARRELGYSFRPARQAIEDAVGWYEKEGLLPGRRGS